MLALLHERIIFTAHFSPLQISVPSERQEQVLTKLGDYINDKDHTVRLEFTRALRAFPSLPAKFILKLFDKKNIGLFIFGAEDEMMEVRRELVLSIETFVGETTAGVVFEYLIDMLNDEAEAVRETVAQVLCRISASCRLTAGVSQLNFILGGLEENNARIRKGILRLLTYELASKVKIVINDCPEILLCYIAVWQDGRVIKLSGVHSIKVLSHSSAFSHE